MRGPSLRGVIGVATPCLIRFRVAGYFILATSAACSRAAAGEATTPMHWAFRPIGPVAVPAPSRSEWAQSHVDRFILTGLEAQSLEPSEPADRRTLLRRAAYDL